MFNFETLPVWADMIGERNGIGTLLLLLLLVSNPKMRFAFVHERVFCYGLLNF